MPGTAEQRSIYSGPIRRALERLTSRIIDLENAVRVVQRAYRWLTATTATNPGDGFIKANAAPGSATELYASAYGQQGMIVDWRAVQSGHDLWVYIAEDGSQYVHYTISGPAVAEENGTWFRVPVTFVAIQDFSPTNNANVIVRIAGTGGGGGAPPSGGGGGAGVTDGDKGDITVSNNGNNWTIDNGAVTNGKLADMGPSTFKGRVSTIGPPQDLSAAQATSLLTPFTVAAQGVVLPPGTVTGKVLRDDGTWADVEGGGGGGTDEVWIGPDPPTDTNIELWFDPDAVSNGGSGTMIVAVAYDEWPPVSPQPDVLYLRIEP